MKIVAITHAEKNQGVNPGLTEKGKADICALAGKLPKGGVKNIIIGTGTRFLDIFDSLCGAGGWVKLDSQSNFIRFSPLLGSADSGKKTETGFDVYLADGTLVPIGDYIGLIGTPGVDLWAWLKSIQTDGTLLCTGREFIGSLGVKDAQMARVYVIDTDTQTVTVVP